jgi:hypothetical protein
MHTLYRGPPFAIISGLMVGYSVLGPKQKRSSFVSHKMMSPSSCRGRTVGTAAANRPQHQNQAAEQERASDAAATALNTNQREPVAAAAAAAAAAGVPPPS